MSLDDLERGSAEIPRVNWAANYRYRAVRVHRPTSVGEVARLVASIERVHVLGSRHSFNDIADSQELISLDGLPADVLVDRDAGTISLSGGMRYGDLAAVLRDEGLALRNLASLPHISVAGAVATATHGSGDAIGNLATAVAGLELITSDGELIVARRGDADFDGMVVGLGALGAVTRLTLDVEPAYEVRQRVYEDLGWDALAAHFHEITAAGYSVSVFTRWGEAIDQVWIKSRVDEAPEAAPDDLFGARPATVERHPIPGMDSVNCTPQLGVAGLWSDRLSHFRTGFTPSAGDELQSEYLVPRDRALGAIDALRGLADRLKPLVQVTELRTVAADRLWMSPQYATDTVGIHFTWVPDQSAVEDALVDVEALLANYGARPHWAKLFLADVATVATLYDRLPDFGRLAARLDPRRAFRNAWLERHVLGPA